MYILYICIYIIYMYIYKYIYIYTVINFVRFQSQMKLNSYRVKYKVVQSTSRTKLNFCNKD